MINVAFIGCGRIADLHAIGYRDHEEARIYAVCDTDEEMARRRRDQWSAERWTIDYHELLRDPRVHAVEVLTPQLLHEGMVIEALAAGKHVAVQKPMTVDLASADRMIEAAAQAGKVLKVTENYVFYPPLMLARKLIDEGAVGAPQGIRIKMLGAGKGGWEVPSAAWEWRVREAAAGRGFATFDHGHHIWSTAWYLLGEVERVTAWIDSCDGIVDSPAVMMWKYRGGARYGVADFTHSNELEIPARYYSNDEWIEVTGDRGLIFVHRCTAEVHQGPAVSLYDSSGWRRFDEVDSDWAAGFVGATQNFIDAIRGRAEPRLSGAEGREVLRFDLAVSRSARLRREVHLDELDARFAPLYALGTWAREVALPQGQGLLDRVGAKLGLGVNTSEHAPRAVALTEEMIARFDAGAAGPIDTVIGLHLTPDNGVEERLTLRIQKGRAELVVGELPKDARLSVRMPAGLWAAILLGKARIETALFQGKIKFEGNVEEALKLREVFGF
jgi:predicted dehydrogenase